MPVLIHAVPEDLHELFENGGLTAIALLRKLGRVVVVAVDAAVVLVVGVRGAKHRRANTAREVLDVIFAIEGCDVRSSQRATACEAEEIQSSEIVGLA
jgi:hypothetical protein